MKTLMIMAAAPVLAMAAPQLAMAQEARSTTASYAGLDLTTEAGQKEFRSRIARAVRSVCTHGNGRLSAREANERSKCIKVALEKSEQQYAQIVSQARYGG